MQDKQRPPPIKGTASNVDGSGLDDGEISGVAVGCLLVGLLIGGGVVFLRFRWSPTNPNLTLTLTLTLTLALILTLTLISNPNPNQVEPDRQAAQVLRGRRGRAQEGGGEDLSTPPMSLGL